MSKIARRVAFWSALLVLIGMSRLLPTDARLVSNMVLLAIASLGFLWVLIENAIVIRESRGQAADKRLSDQNQSRLLASRIFALLRRR
jgi:hypothetical protein